MSELNELRALYDIFDRSPHGQWIVDFDDYRRLPSLLKQHQPKRILELGTGIGAATAVLAKYSDASIDTVEHLRKCITIAKDLIPSELQERVTFHHSDSQLFAIAGLKHFIFQRYKELPKGEYDFVVIDGPGPYTDPQGFLIDMPGGDFIPLIYMTKPGAIFYIDGRKPMVKLMDRFFRHYFEPIYESETAPNHTILRRVNDAPAADGPLAVSDALEEWLMSKGYFNDL